MAIIERYNIPTSLEEEIKILYHRENVESWLRREIEEVEKK